MLEELLRNKKYSELKQLLMRNNTIDELIKSRDKEDLENKLYLEKTKNGRVGIIATEGTVLSGAFERELLKIQPGIKIFQKACPLLVPIIEAGEYSSKATELILKEYLSYFKNKNIDTLILGCTHYGILENKIRKIAGKKIKIISEAKIVSKKLKNYLERHKEIEIVLGKNKIINFYSTDLTNRFKTLGKKFFGKNIDVNKVVI